MNLVYLTPLWTGVCQIFESGDIYSSPRGMKAFYKVFKSIIHDERINSIVVYLFVKKDKTSERQSISKRIGIKTSVIVYYWGNYWELLCAFARLTVEIINKCRRKEIDVIYSHGYCGAIGGVLCRLLRIPGATRIYGLSGVFDLSDKGVVKFALNSPLVFLSLRMVKDICIITDDGTSGHLFSSRYGSKRRKYITIRNGVDNLESRISKKPKNILPEKYISYIARIHPRKNQLLWIKALRQLNGSNLEIPCVLIGQVSDDHYHNQIKGYLRQHNMHEQITYIESLETEEINYIVKHSAYTGVLYEVANVGNMFMEAYSAGCPIISRNINGCLEAFPKNSYFNVDSHDPQVLADAMKSLWTNSDVRGRLSNAARTASVSLIPIWEARIEYEKNILLNIAKQK